MLVIGLMSGTSADGIDAVLMSISGAPPCLDWQLIKHIHQPFTAQLQSEILACYDPITSSSKSLCALNSELGVAFAHAALAVLEHSGITPPQIDLVGSHGQTVWHSPDDPLPSTLQVGEPAYIAEATGITTIANFRPRDMSAGGQGAPLVAYVDALLFSHPDITRVCQNIGGIANLTYLPNNQLLHKGAAQLAFDTGPGNTLLDFCAQLISGGTQSCDLNGRIAQRGTVNQPLLETWLADEPYFKRKPPKTTGRELFSQAYCQRLIDQARERSLCDEDLFATLTALTAESIAGAYRDFLPEFPQEVIVSGGGTRNPTLMAMLAAALKPAKVLVSDELGLPVEAKEAAAFAVLAYETWHNRPGNLPSATGARHPVVLGSITPGANYRQLIHKTFMD